MKISWDIRNVYLYLVSFVSLMLIIFGVVQFIGGVIDIVYPPPVEIYQPKVPPLESNVTQDQWDEQQLEQQHNEIRRQRYYSTKRLITNAALLVVVLPLYWYHWRKIQNLESRP